MSLTVDNRLFDFLFRLDRIDRGSVREIDSDLNGILTTEADSHAVIVTCEGSLRDDEGGLP